ncbi:MAG: polyprenyl synthetase family protein, partial [Bacteroidetes bacterium]|nr:polyprenyl synthetase family protein [Bacteroidota bacterium]
KEKIKRVKDIFGQLNIDFLTSEEIEKYYIKGMDYLNLINIDEDNKEILKDIASKMILRDK